MQIGTTTVPDQPAFLPRELQSLDDTGLPFGMILDLALKHAYFEGTATLDQLARRMKLSPVLMHTLYRYLMKEQLCETRKMIANDYEIALTGKGRSMAEIAMSRNHYAGPVPVPLPDYSQAVNAQTLNVRVTWSNLRAALSDLVLPDSVLRELGAALAGGGAILLYGGTGNGKTSIGERLDRLFEDLIYVPYAVEVAGQIVTVFDPLLHREAKGEAEPVDARWVACHRPMIKVGGEMRTDMLDTRLDEATRVGVAPLQMKANNGILLIDDFGRQRITPRELLNRWIVPLDRGVDILSLWTGFNFEIPFDVVVVFATNLSLSDLAEEAFIRRLKNKIRIDPLEEEPFKELLRRVCAENDISCSTAMAEYICRECQKHAADGLRGCFPADLIRIVRGVASFEQREPALTKEDVDEAVRMYFAR